MFSRVLAQKYLFVVALAVLFFIALPQTALATTTIASCTDLQKIGNDPSFLSSGTYNLTTNINCNATATWNPDGSGGYYGFSPLRNFSGVFDGEDHTIFGLYISTTTPNVGLFGNLATPAVVKNLRFSGGGVHGTNSNVGVLVGNMTGSSRVEYIINSSPVYGNQNTGGLVGNLGASATISNATSSSIITIVGTGNTVGGLVGSSYGTITKSYAGVYLTGGNNAFIIGGLVGANNASGNISSSTSAMSIDLGTGANLVGGIAGTNSNIITGSHFEGQINLGANAYNIGGIVGDDASDKKITNTFYNIDFTAFFQADQEDGLYAVTPFGIYNDQYTTWEEGGYAALNFSDYFGAADGSGYIHLTTEDDLKHLLPFSSTNLLTGKKFKLMNSIAVSPEFMIPYMSATEFNGNNMSITGLSFNRPWGDVGLFGTIADGTTVKDLTVSGVSIVAHGAGALAYANNGVVQNVVTSGTITGEEHLGGIVGLMTPTGSIENSNSSVSILSAAISGDYFGGLVGYSEGTITGSHATGNVTINNEGSQYIGGLIGYSYGAVSNSFATGDVTGSQVVGGLAGNSSDSLSASYATGNIHVKGTTPSFIGGLVGYSDASITDAFALGSIDVNMGDGSVVEHIGGLVGRSDNQITNTYALGDVTSLRPVSHYVGGLIGYNNGNLAGSFSGGLVTASTDNNTIGGFIGRDTGYPLIHNGWIVGASTHAIGQEDAPPSSGAAVDLLVTDEYGIDATSSADFFGSTAAVYTDSPWDFSITWNDDASSTPTLKGLTPPAMPDLSFTITASAGSGGSITPSGTVSLFKGATQEFTISANSGNSISTVSVDGVDAGALTSKIFTFVAADHTIAATFSGGSSGGGAGSTNLSNSTAPLSFSSGGSAVRPVFNLRPPEQPLATSTRPVYQFTRNLKLNDKGPDVLQLQKFLNTHGFVIAKKGVGSPGQETNLFGSQTKIALATFQEAHAKEILAPAKLKKGTGLFADGTRAVVNSILKKEARK